MRRIITLGALVVSTTLIIGACAGPGASPTATSAAATSAPATDAPATDAPATDAPATATAAPATATAAPAATGTALPGEGFLVCQVSDTGGIDDKSFNQNAWAGTERARDELGVEIRFLESTTAEDYARNINQHITDGCDLIITVGFLLGDDTGTAAAANPEQRFAIVDFAFDPALPNVEGLVYSTVDAAMLAGYASASWTKTGKMGTFGGINIGGPVTDFMDGFVAGANYWNAQKDGSVEVLGGRDPLDPTSGTFTGDFSSTDNAKNLTNGFLDEDADVILPVGGPIGQGTFAAIRERNAEAVGLGVDVDWTQTVPEYADLMLTHILKRIDNSVFQAIERAVNGEAPQPLFVSTLANEGVDLGEFHDYDAEISDETKAEIATLKQALIDGTVVAADYYAPAP